MRRQILRLSVGQTSKVLALMYGAMGLVLVPIFLLIAANTPVGMGFGIGYAIAVPIFYAIIGYIFTAIGCALYNVIAKMVGGIEVEVQDAGTAI